MGDWYEITRDKDVWYEQNVECVTASYSLDSGSKEYPVTVNNRQYDRAKDKVKDSFIPGTNKTISKAKFDDQGNGRVKFIWYPAGNYQVLDYDPESYSVVYGCDNWLGGLFHTQQGWLLSRTQEASDDLKSHARDVINEKVGQDVYDVDLQWLETHQGSDCKYGIPIE